MAISKNFWQIYGWVNRGSQRKKVIIQLTEKPITAEEFRKEFNQKESSNSQLSLREVSRHFTTFSKKGIMNCLTPKEPYGKLYVLTELGHKIRKELVTPIK